MPLLHTHWNPPVGKWPGSAEWLRAAGITGVNATKGPRFSDGAVALQAAVEGQGIALASQALAVDHLAAGRLVKPFKISVATDFRILPRLRESASGRARPRRLPALALCRGKALPTREVALLLHPDCIQGVLGLLVGELSVTCDVLKSVTR
jgi:DNA-binding transcriptional LysR family regulator